MPSSRVPLGRAASAAALILFAALRARGESSFASTDGGTEGAGSVGSVGADGRRQATSGGAIAGEDVEIPVAADARAPATASTVIELDRFAGQQTSAAELVAAAPGTTVRSLGGPLQTSTLSLRGASADESAVLLDGIPLHGPGGGAFDLSAIPASLISRLVVHRGVLGAQLGAGALGGALEIIPRSAGEAAHGGVSASYGSFGTAQLAADLSGGQGTLFEGATAALQLDRTSGDFNYLRSFTPDVPDSPLVQETRENDDGQRLGFLARGERQIAPRLLLDLIALGTFGEVGLPGAIGNFTPAARSADQGGILGARLRASVGSAVLTARAWAQADRIVLSDFGNGFSSCPAGSTDSSCAPAENHSIAARGAGEAAFPIGSLQWATISLEGGGEWFAGQGAGAHRRGVGSLSLRDELTFLQGALSIHPALRLDAVGSDLAASPAVAIAARPFSGTLAPLELRASGGTSFRAPTIAELFLEQGSTLPNPELRPERAGSIEAGASWVAPWATISASAFWSRYRDLILYELYPPARAKPFNVGEARILGAELEALVSLPLGFTAEAAWSYLDAVDERGAATEIGQKLPYRPPHRLFARLARHGDRLEGFVSFDFSAAVPRNQFGTSQLPAQFTIDCGAGVRAIGPLWVDLELKNLLDDETLQDLFLYPLPGLSLTAIARARF